MDIQDDRFEIPLSLEALQRLETFPLSRCLADPLSINPNVFPCRIIPDAGHTQLRGVSYGLPWTASRRRIVLEKRIQQCRWYALSDDPDVAEHVSLIERYPFRICEWGSFTDFTLLFARMSCALLLSWIFIFFVCWLLGVLIVSQWFNHAASLSGIIAELGLNPVIPAENLNTQPFSTRLYAGLFYAIPLSVIFGLIMAPLYLMLEIAPSLARVTSITLILSGAGIVWLTGVEGMALGCIVFCIPIAGFVGYSLIAGMARIYTTRGARCPNT